MEFYFCVFSYHARMAVIVHKMLQYLLRCVAWSASLMHIFYTIGSSLLLVFATEKRTKDGNSGNNDNLDKVTIWLDSIRPSPHIFFVCSKSWNPNTSDCGEKCKFFFSEQS
jgi:hypothetical protein